MFFQCFKTFRPLLIPSLRFHFLFRPLPLERVGSLWWGDFLGVTSSVLDSKLEHGRTWCYCTSSTFPSLPSWICSSRPTQEFCHKNLWQDVFFFQSMPILQFSWLLLSVMEIGGLFAKQDHSEWWICAWWWDQILRQEFWANLHILMEGINYQVCIVARIAKCLCFPYMFIFIFHKLQEY